MDITTIELGVGTRAVLTDDHRILLEGGTRNSSNARVVVHDIDVLARALRELDLERQENIYRAEREARKSEPIDQPTRSALFAALAEVYGKEIVDEDHRDERLDILSTLAGKPILSLSKRGNMYMADAHRVLDILGTMRGRA